MQLQRLTFVLMVFFLLGGVVCSALAGGPGAMEYRTVVVDYEPNPSGAVYGSHFDTFQYAGGGQEVSFKGGAAFKKTMDIPRTASDLYVHFVACTETHCGWDWGPFGGVLRCRYNSEPLSAARCNETRTQTQNYVPTTSDKTIYFRIRNSQMTITEE